MATQRSVVIERPMAPIGPLSAGRSAILRKNTIGRVVVQQARARGRVAAHPGLDVSAPTPDPACIGAAADHFLPDGAVGMAVLAGIADADHRPSGIRIRPEPWICRKYTSTGSSSQAISSPRPRSAPCSRSRCAVIPGAAVRQLGRAAVDRVGKARGADGRAGQFRLEIAGEQRGRVADDHRA